MSDVTDKNVVQEEYKQIDLDELMRKFDTEARFRTLPVGRRSWS